MESTTSPLVSTESVASIFSKILAEMVRGKEPTLTTRQLTIFMMVYTAPKNGAHTVGGLSVDLNVPKPSITRGLDRLTELKFVIRKKSNPKDKRDTHVFMTPHGKRYFTKLNQIITAEMQ